MGFLKIGRLQKFTILKERKELRLMDQNSHVGADLRTRSCSAVPGLGYMGADIVSDKARPMVLEINARPIFIQVANRAI